HLVVYRVTPKKERPCPPCTSHKGVETTHKSNCGMVSLNPTTGSVTYFCMSSRLNLDMGIIPGFVCSPMMDLQDQKKIDDACQTLFQTETDQANFFLKYFGGKLQVLR